MSFVPKQGPLPPDPKQGPLPPARPKVVIIPVTVDLRGKIQDRLKNAMRAKDSIVLSTYRSLLAAITTAEKAAGSKTLTDADTMAIITKAASQRRESIAIYTAQKREDLASKERTELTIIETLLPKKLTPEELVSVVDEIVKKGGYNKISDMKDVIAKVTEAHLGRFDPRLLAPEVKDALARSQEREKKDKQEMEDV